MVQAVSSQRRQQQTQSATVVSDSRRNIARMPVSKQRTVLKVVHNVAAEPRHNDIGIRRPGAAARGSLHKHCNPIWLPGHHNHDGHSVSELGYLFKVLRHAKSMVAPPQVPLIATPHTR